MGSGIQILEALGSSVQIFEVLVAPVSRCLGLNRALGVILFEQIVLNSLRRVLTPPGQQ